MLQKVQLQTPEGMIEYPFVPDSRAYDEAVAAGEITVGMDIVYRSFLVHIVTDFAMLILTPIAPPMGAGMPGWSFQINGIPVDFQTFRREDPIQ